VSGGKVAVALATVAAVAAMPAVALAGSKGAPVVGFSPSATLARDDTGLAVGGSIRCTRKRDFTLNVFVVEPSRNLLAWGDFPGAGAKPSAYACGGAARKWKVVVTNPGETSSRFAPGPVRVCLVVRSWSGRSGATLDSSCETVAARA
jgi:hypothetical protein